jgi:hypothetical protein
VQAFPHKCFLLSTSRSRFDIASVRDKSKTTDLANSFLNHTTSSGRQAPSLIVEYVTQIWFLSFVTSMQFRSGRYCYLKSCNIAEKFGTM